MVKVEKEYRFKCIVEKAGDAYFALCLDLDIATEGTTTENAKNNLIEAIGLYLISAIETGEEKEFIPRPVPMRIRKKYQRDVQEIILKDIDLDHAACLAYV